MAFVYLNQSPSMIRLIKPQPADTIDHLPAKVYTLGCDEKGVYLETLRENFTLPEKIYGPLNAHCAMLYEAYRGTKSALGAVMTGQKGAGKSLLAEMVANKLLQMGVPVIYVAAALPPSMITDVVRNIGPCCVIFEEFGKYFPKESTERASQADLLPLFSDSSLNGVLFLITENDSLDINSYYRNRPGRIEFWLEMQAAKGKDFVELAEGYPIHPEVLDYVVKYVELSGVGSDTLLRLRDLAVNTPTVEAFADKLMHRNMPKPYKEVMMVAKVWDKLSSEPRLCAIQKGKTTSDMVTVRVFNQVAELIETVEIPRAALEVMAEIDDPFENTDKTVLYRYTTEQTVFLLQIATSAVYECSYSEMSDWSISHGTSLNPFHFKNKAVDNAESKAGRVMPEMPTVAYPANPFMVPPPGYPQTPQAFGNEPRPASPVFLESHGDSVAAMRETISRKHLGNIPPNRI